MKRRRAALPAPLPPRGDQCARGLAHSHRHPDRALSRVRDRHRVVEEHHNAVARELVEGALELADERGPNLQIRI